MKWKEVIQVKSYNPSLKHQAFLFINHLDLPNRPDMPECLELLDGHNLDTEICLFLHWNTQTDTPAKSQYGLTLSQLLSEYGWIHHSVWVNRKTVFRKGEQTI